MLRLSSIVGSLLIATFCGCAAPMAGDPCDATEPACGQHHLGLQCKEGYWAAYCTGCDPDDDDDDKSVSICIAQRVEDCGQGPALPACGNALE